MSSEVWIVLHDESPDNTVLGVFADQGEAYAYAEEVSPRFPNGAMTVRYPIGYRYDAGPGHVSFGPYD